MALFSDASNSGGGGLSITGSDKQVFFNDSGALGANAALTFDKTTGKFIIRQTGGVAGTDEMQMYHDGTLCRISNLETGALQLSSNTFQLGFTSSSTFYTVVENSYSDTFQIFKFYAKCPTQTGHNQYMTLTPRNTNAYTEIGISGSSGLLLSSAPVMLNGLSFTASAGGSQDVYLLRDAANTLAQRSSTSAQEFRLYGTYTDASNYERLSIKHNGSSTGIVFESQAAGTGTKRIINFKSDSIAVLSTGDTNTATLSLGAGSYTLVHGPGGPANGGIKYDTVPQELSPTASGGGLNGWALKNHTRSIVVPADTATVLTSADSGKIYDNTGFTAKRAFTLPAATAGYFYTWTVNDADGIDITAVGDDVIRFGASVTSVAGTITSTTIGSSITLVAINSTTWFATSLVGTWA